MTVSTIYTPTNAYAVTKSDSNIQNAQSFYVGVGGDVAVMPLAQMSASSPTAVTLKAVATGSLIHLVVAKFMSTNTTATNIIAFD